MKNLLLLIAAALLVTACAQNDPIQAAARAQMEADGFGEAAITQTAEGNPEMLGAQELYCVATDATTSDLPYLLVVYQVDGEWQAQQMLEGYYEWDLNGCPR